MAMTGGTAKLVHTGYCGGNTSKPIQVYVYYKSSQSIENNKSTVYCGMYVTTPSGWDIGPWTDFNGSYVGTKSNTFNGDIPNFEGTQWLVENEKFTVEHASDGTGSAIIYWKWGVNSPWGKTQNPSGSFRVTLPTIPRASSLSLSTKSVSVGSNITANINRASSSFTHKVEFYINSSYRQEYADVSTSRTFTIPTSWYNAMPSVESCTAYCKITTYNGSKQIGSPVKKSFKVVVPSSVKPTVGDIELTPTKINSNEILIKGKNKLIISVSGCSAGTGSSIKSYKFSGPSISKIISSTSASASTSISSVTDVENFTNQVAEIKYKVTVTDARGRSATKTQTINCYDYYTPYISKWSAFRANSDKSANPNGTYIMCKYTPKYASVNSTNSATVTAYYSDGTTSKSQTGASGQVLINLNGDADTTYKVYLKIVDKYSGTKSTTTLIVYGKARILNITADGTGIALGKMADTLNAFDCSLPMKLTSTTTTQSTAGFHISDPSDRYLTITRKDATDDINQDGEDETVDVRMQFYVANTGNATCRRRYSTDGGGSYTTQGYWQLGDSRMYISYPIYVNGNVETVGDIVCSEAYNGSNFAVICQWADGENHDLLVRNKDGLTAAVGSYVSSTHSSNTRLDLRGGTVRTVNASGATTVSDERLKTDWEDLNKYNEFYNSIEPKSFKYINGSSGRNHIGFSAQQIEQSLVSSGLSTSDFAGLVKYKVDPSSEEYNGYDEEYGLIYSEFIALNTYMIQKLQDEIKSLKVENSILKDALMSIEGKIDQLSKTNEN